MMANQFKLRRASMKWTDARARAVLEVLGAMRVVKYFCYEGSFLARAFFRASTFPPADGVQQESSTSGNENSRGSSSSSTRSPEGAYLSGLRPLV
jgi:hypothetical protein